MSSSLIECLANAERAGLRRPWEIIYNRTAGRPFAGGELIPNAAIDPLSLRIVDADRRLLIRIHADPEQALTAEDMALIVEAVNAL